MRTPSGGFADETSGPAQQRSRPSPGAVPDRLIAHRRERAAGDIGADASARQLVADLEEAILTLEGRPAEAAFEHAARKLDHLEDLRRVLGILLDVLADWETFAERG